MARAYAGDAPQVGRRTSDVRERQIWEQQQIVKEQPSRDLDRRMQAYREQRERDEADEARRVADGNARYREAVEADKRAVEKRTFDRLLAMIFDGASDAERAKVSRLVEQRPPEQRTIEVYEVTLMRLRAELEGTVPGAQIDWRSAVGMEENL
jgi:hypothetical protein